MKILKSINNKNGITLVALVVTIIILIILAGVSVVMVLGENGLIAKAKEAKQKTEQAKLQEEAIFSEAEDYIESIGKQAGEKTSDLLDGETVVGEKIADGAGKVVPVPEGFYYVGGTVDKGAVISDNEADKDKYKGQADVGKDLQGNQFVFIPANGGSLKYEQNHKYDSKHSFYYTNYTTWAENDLEGIKANEESTKKYGGFFIGRYEAGWPDAVTVGQDIRSGGKNTGEKVPVSKANTPSWNLISQINAEEASKKMYSADSKVKSRLVDSYAWDTICTWLINSGIVKETSEGKIDSSSYGNYTNSNFTVKDVWYSKHIWLTANADSGEKNNWYIGKGGKETYNKGDVTVGGKTVTPPTEFEMNYTAGERVEIATGSAEQTKLNNIYDLAGNMWEWTTEESYHKRQSDGLEVTFAVRRGCSFHNNGSDNPVVYRYGYQEEGGTGVEIGFRVVLYIK